MREDHNRRTLTETARVRRVDDGRTREDRSVLVRCEGDPVVLPGVEVRARGVAPVHRSPHVRRRVVLVEGVPDAVDPAEAVGVVEPACRRCEMHNRPDHLEALALPPSAPV